MSGMARALTGRGAATDASSDDPRLRGRTYAIPFERVWQGALGLAQRLRGWTVHSSDDIEGTIRAEVRSFLGFTDDVVIHVTLDPDGQTRVELVSEARAGHGGDLGRNARRIGRFLRALDKRLGLR